MRDWLEIWILLGAIVLIGILDSAHAGPLREPKQCTVFWRNIEKVEAWTYERKNDLYFQCLQRAMSYREAANLTVEDAIFLRDAWALTPPPEQDDDEP